MSNAPQGWYDDPQDSTSLHYWDGERWTGSRQLKPQPQQGVSVWKIITGVGVGVLAALAAVWFFVQVSQPSELECATQRLNNQTSGTPVEQACR